MQRGRRFAEGGNSGIIGQFKLLLDRRRLGELLVSKGLVTPRELRFALAVQKETSAPLGEVFIRQSLISRHELNVILMKQMALRLTAAALLALLSLQAFAGKKAKADTFDNANGMEYVSVTQAFSKAAAYSLLGTDEKRSSNLSAFTKWSGMFSRYERELQTPSGRAMLASWEQNLDSLKGMPLRSMASRVNDFMNKKPYIVDSRNWGQSDYWETPVEFMSRGGDCEDFAIAKYAALRTLGVPEERMRLAIVQDTLKNIPHAVLAVYTDEGVVILDNQIKTLVDADSPGRYRPIFSINRTAWWLHKAPEVTQIASR